MSWAAVIIGGSAIVAGGISYLGSKDSSTSAKRAARSQAEASQYATDIQYKMYQQGREDLAPWREAGARSLSDLERIQQRYEGAVLDPSTYTQSPGYDWLRQQGLSAVERSAAAKGKLDSGENLKDLTRYGQGLALQDYQGYLGRLEALMNRYAGTAQVGQTASNTLAGLGTNTASNIGQYQLYAGNAMAQGYLNQANARTSLYQNLSNIGTNAANQWMLNNYLNQTNQQPTQQNTQTSFNPSWYGGG